MWLCFWDLYYIYLFCSIATVLIQLYRPNFDIHHVRSHTVSLASITAETSTSVIQSIFEYYKDFIPKHATLKNTHGWKNDCDNLL